MSEPMPTTAERVLHAPLSAAALRPQLERHSLFTEGLLLALASALSYSVAFAYEAGFARAYGLPLEVIDLGLTTVLIAGSTILGLLFALCQLGSMFYPLSFAGRLYQGPPKSLVWWLLTRRMLLPALSVSIVLIALFGLRYWRTVAVVIAIWAIAFVVFEIAVLALVAHYVRPKSSEGKPFRENWGALTAVFLDRVRADSASAPIFLRFWPTGAVSIAALLLLVGASQLGDFKAQNAIDFFVVERERSYVVLRVYDGVAYTAALSDDRRSIERVYRAFPLADTSLVMHREDLGFLRLAPEQPETPPVTPR